VALGCQEGIVSRRARRIIDAAIDGCFYRDLARAWHSDHPAIDAAFAVLDRSLYRAIRRTCEGGAHA
jgi:hypothetical protein